MLIHNSQQKQQTPNSQEDRNTLNKNRNQYNAEIDNTTRMLITVGPSTTHPNRETCFNTCHIVCLTQLTHMVEMVFLQTACNKKLKIEDIPIPQHHLDDQIKIITNEAFIIEDHPGQIIGLKALIHLSTPIMSFISPTLLLITQKHHHMPGEQFTRTIY